MRKPSSFDDKALADRKTHEVEQAQDEHAGPHRVNRSAPQPFGRPLFRSKGVVLLGPLTEGVEHGEAGGEEKAGGAHARAGVARVIWRVPSEAKHKKTLHGRVIRSVHW